MRFTINQADLIGPLSAVSRSVGLKAQLPILSNILISAITGRLKLQATNLEVGVVKEVEADVLEEGEVTVPARILVDIVSNLSGEKIEFGATIDQLTIQTLSFNSKINGISANEFPAIPLKGLVAISLDPETIIKALPEVSFASAVDEGRPVLTGILVGIKDKKLELVATDGYRLAHKSVVVAEEGEFKALIPRRTFEEVARLLSEEEVDKVEIGTSDNQNQIIFNLGKTQLSSRLIEGQFPSWERIIPTEIKSRVIVDRAEVIKAVKLASVFAKSESNIIRLENTANKLILSSEAKELGEQTKQVKADGSGEEMKITFNAKFLHDALNALSSSQVIIELSGPLQAASFKPIGEEGLQYIIMPVNLS